MQSRYGTGYSLLIRLRQSSDAEKTRRRVMETFPGAVMKVSTVFCWMRDKRLVIECSKVRKLSWREYFFPTYKQHAGVCSRVSTNTQSS